MAPRLLVTMEPVAFTQQRRHHCRHCPLAGPLRVSTSTSQLPTVLGLARHWESHIAPPIDALICHEGPRIELQPISFCKGTGQKVASGQDASLAILRRSCASINKVGRSAINASRALKQCLERSVSTAHQESRFFAHRSSDSVAVDDSMRLRMAP